eukprot:tig00000076_g2452.t1
MGTLDALPDAVVSSVFKTLGTQAMWPLRCVCRRWRQVIEETEWPSFELRTDDKKPELKKSASGAGAGSAPSRHGAAAALVEKRKLRLGDGASVSLGAGWREVEAACGLLAALVRSGGGGGSGAASAQPREVVFRVLGSEDGDEEDGYGEDFLSRFVLGALRELRPPGGAPSRLESLHLCLWNGEFTQILYMSLPPASDLRTALSPFGKLLSLTFYFQAVHNGVTPEAAAVVAAACPLLRSLSFRPDFDSESAALAALAPLAHLERLALLFNDEHSDLCVEVDASGGGFGTIADGPAGRSLRSLFFLDEDAVGGSDAFLRLSRVVARRLDRFAPKDFSEAAFRALARLPRLERLEPVAVDARRLDHFARAELSEAAARAVLRLPRLERLEPLRFYLEDVSPDAIRALGGAACLRELFLRLEDGRAPSAAALGALGEAIAALPCLSRLRIELHARSTGPGEVAALLSSAGARRSLAGLDLVLSRPFSEAEAEALAALPALPALRRLFLFALPPPLESSAALRPYEILARLGPEVAVKVDLVSSALPSTKLARPRAAIDALLVGRRPYP